MRLEYFSFFLDLLSTINSITTDTDCSADDSDFTLESNELSKSASTAKDVTIVRQDKSSPSNKSLEDSLHVVNACNDEEMYVDSSKAKGVNKKHFCFYCKKLQTKIARHLECVHPTEEEVKRFIYFPKGSLLHY